ncbi:hypothetical protein UlMin_024428 [Ulmus minor]
MEALNFLRFWKPTNTFPALVEVDNENEEEEEDSFFDLELAPPNFEEKKDCPDEKTAKQTSRISDFDEESSKIPTRTASGRELFYPKPSLSQSPSRVDPISKRKILPVEPISKPQSPMALLKSSPTLRVFMFKKSKSSTTQKTQKTEPCKGKLFTLKLNLEDDSKSSTRKPRIKSQNPISEDSKTERFSKDVLQKYLKLVKPLYVKVSKRCSEKINASGDFSMPSPSSSPSMMSSMGSMREKPGNIPAGIRIMCKHLGKSRSASAASVALSPANRRDDSLLEQNDGIQSAILHCKRSFNSSRDSWSLSRSTSDSSSMKSCTSDPYRISQSASETSHDSARSSIEDGRSVIMFSALQ